MNELFNPRVDDIGERRIRYQNAEDIWADICITINLSFSLLISLMLLGHGCLGQ